MAQVGEVPQGCRSAQGGVDGVVDLAADRSPAASGEPAVLVASAEKVALRERGPVPVDGHKGPVDGVGEHPRPRWGVPGQAPGGVRIDRRPADKVRGAVVGAEEGEGGDDDLHLRADRAEPAGCVAGAGRVDRWAAGEEEVGEDVGTDLIDTAGVPVVFLSGVDDDLRGCQIVCVRGGVPD